MLSDWMMDWNQVIMCKCIACNSHECHVPCRAVLCSIHLIILFTFTFTFISWRSKTSRCVHAYEGLCCTSVCNTAKYLNLILKQFVGNSLIKIRFTTSPTIYVVSFIIYIIIYAAAAVAVWTCVFAHVCVLSMSSHMYTQCTACTWRKKYRKNARTTSLAHQRVSALTRSRLFLDWSTTK